MCALRWDERPSPDHTSRVPIPVLRVPKGGQLYVWLLGPFRGLWTHYLKKKTYPCQTSGCPYCEAAPARWKGYAPVLCWKTDVAKGKPRWMPFVLEVTEKLADLVEREDLIGHVLHLWRVGVRPNGPLAWEVAPDSYQPTGEPPIKAFDVEPILERVFDLAGRHLRPPMTAAMPDTDGASALPAVSAAIAEPEAPFVPPTAEQLAELRARIDQLKAGIGTNGTH